MIALRHPTHLAEGRIVQFLGLRVLPAPRHPVVCVRTEHPMPPPEVYEAEPVQVVTLPDGTEADTYADGTTVYLRAESIEPSRTRPAGTPGRAGMLRPASPPVIRERRVERAPKPVLPRNPLRRLWLRLAVTVEVYRAQHERWRRFGTAPERFVGAGRWM